ncbi:MAG: c-type cytochrome [Azonexus sp.]|nr:c-type cytochrome [Azonexus sp.]
MQKRMKLGVIGLFLLALSAASFASEMDKFDTGKREFMNRCAVCHGPSGKGDDGAIDILKTTPTDLTTLSKRNGGTFPYERVYSVIDGRLVVKGHGSREMPVWGQDYNLETAKAEEHFGAMPYSMEMYVRSRILALLDYLYRIQKK